MFQEGITVSEILKCIKCKSTDLSGPYLRSYKYKASFQYRCKICGTKFTIDPTTNTKPLSTLYPNSIVLRCFELRKNCKKILEIKKTIKEENKINLGKRTICTWLKKLRENLEECELKDWEEVVGILVRVENLGEERRLTIHCKRTLFVIKVPKNLMYRSLLGKRIALLKTDLPEKPFLIRELKRF